MTAAAPVAVAAAAGRRWRRCCRPGRGGEGRVRRHPHRRRRPEDPGHQGRPRAHQPGPQGGQGPRRRRPQARAREGQQGGRRGRQGQARRGRRLRRGQVIDAGPAVGRRRTSIRARTVAELRRFAPDRVCDDRAQMPRSQIRAGHASHRREVRAEPGPVGRGRSERRSLTPGTASLPCVATGSRPGVPAVRAPGRWLIQFALAGSIEHCRASRCPFSR